MSREAPLATSIDEVERRPDLGGDCHFGRCDSFLWDDHEGREFEKPLSKQQFLT
jgi:hypothetical protein